MDIDPIFHAIDGPDVSNIHNIESEDDVDACGPPAFDAAQECDFMACGAGGVCGALEESANGRQVGCACADGTVARVGQDPKVGLWCHVVMHALTLARRHRIRVRFSFRIYAPVEISAATTANV